MRKISLTINDRSVEVVASPDLALLDLLRETLGLTGAKQSCDRKGQCGACTVLVDGRAVRSCLRKVADLNGVRVVTVEGLGTPDNPHLIQEAFVLAGAVQCGFCTPGLIMAAKALLDATPDPDTAAIKHALRHNLCRCTGYAKIIDAVKLAGRFLRGETTPEQVRPDPDGPKIGVSHPRPTAMAKACGTARFTADIVIPGALELAVVRSPHRHARITGIDTAAAAAMPGVAGVMTADHILGTNRLKYIVSDRPVLCEKRVRCLGDPVAVVAAATREQARAAAAAVAVIYEPLPEVNSPAEALADDAPAIDDELSNLCFRQPLVKGDAEAALAGSAHMVRARFNTQLNHQAPLEPEACAAYLEDGDQDPQLVVIGRSINIHHAMGLLQDALGYDNMRYEEAFSGGQFGIKLNITSEGIAGAAALHFKRPVRYIPSLAESMVMTSKRHPFTMDVRLGADEKGRLTAYTNDFVVDNGAYYLNGNVIVLRALMMLSGSYHIPAVAARGELVYTNNPWGAAARGAGPPQVNFALESAMDMLAAEAGMDPLEFRRINTLIPGQSKSTGEVPDQWPLPELLDAVQPHYDRARSEAAAAGGATLKRGVGLATGSFGIGGAGDTARAAVELDTDGGVTIFAAAADPGEGNDSMLTQIAAHLLDLPLAKVRLVSRDTDRTAASGPAAGSRITYMVGGALVEVLNQLKQAMHASGATTRDELAAAGRPVRFMGVKKNPTRGPLDPATGQGSAFDSQVHAVQMAEVEVDVAGGEVRVIKMTTAVDAGTVIHPQNLEGQLEGGMDQGAGYALREIFIAGQTRDWVTFRFPTMKTAFDTEIIIRETPRNRGTLGATGIGEMTLVPTAPAIANAIADACGIRIHDLPATPDKVRAALEQLR